MRKIIENMVVSLVVLLFLLVIALVVKYNMINDGSDDVYNVPVTVEKKKTKQEETKAYLNSLESYGNDVDVKVDPTKEKKKNVVQVKSELVKDDMDTAIKTDDKKAYVDKLEQYSEQKESTPDTAASLQDVAPQQEQNGDNIGSELDSILGDESASKKKGNGDNIGAELDNILGN